MISSLPHLHLHKPSAIATNILFLINGDLREWAAFINKPTDDERCIDVRNEIVQDSVTQD